MSSTALVLPAMVIDDRGEIWPLGASELRAHLPRAAGEEDVAAYVVRHRGFVLLRQQGRRLRAVMRPAMVKPATLISLYYCLIDRRPEQIVLSRLEGEHGWHEVFDDFAEFAATVERAIEDESLQRYRPLYASSSRPLDHLGRPRYSRFAPLIALWHARHGRLPGDLAKEVLRCGVHARSCLLRNPTGTGRLIFEHMGAGYSFFGNACLSLTLIGRDLETLPDRGLAEWAAPSYHECLADEKPRLQVVSAVIEQPRGDRYWSYYDRLLLPWRNRDGTGFVLSVAEVRRRTLAA
jgi:hypothetical protein